MKVFHKLTILPQDYMDMPYNIPPPAAHGRYWYSNVEPIAWRKLYNISWAGFIITTGIWAAVVIT